MTLTILQAQIIINFFKHININQPVQMVAVDYLLSPFEGNINPVDTTEFKLYIQSKK